MTRMTRMAALSVAVMALVAARSSAQGRGEAETIRAWLQGYDVAFNAKGNGICLTLRAG